ncbi:MAG: hypothetical protein IJ333_02690 [Clostridia bacterium]|nr:hypothetical protein [Clostridia bacterium]
MYSKTEIRFKTFYLSFEAIIDLCEGFEEYFSKHPEEKLFFPRCNAYKQPHDLKIYLSKKKRDILKKQIEIGWVRSHKCTRSREMFRGQKTEPFEKLLQLIGIEVDGKYLEAEFYFTPPGQGNVYLYSNGDYCIFFDFFIDPTAQIECCKMALSFPKAKEAEVTAEIQKLLDTCPYSSKKISDESLQDFMNDSRTRLIRCKQPSSSSFPGGTYGTQIHHG